MRGQGQGEGAEASVMKASMSSLRLSFMAREELRRVVMSVCPGHSAAETLHNYRRAHDTTNGKPRQLVTIII